MYSPDSYRIVDVCVCMGLSHGADLSTEMSLGVNSGGLDSCTYHVMCKHSLGLHFREEMQHCCSGRKNLGETHNCRTEKYVRGIENRGNVNIYIIDRKMENRIVSSSWLCHTDDPAGSLRHPSSSHGSVIVREKVGIDNFYGIHVHHMSRPRR